MYFCHASAIWNEYPELVAGVLAVDGLTGHADLDARVGGLTAVADSRLASHAEGELPEIQAWRRVFTRMGLKPTQYRCASEALLRRYRKEGALPRIHPLVDLCNAVSLAFAIPVAVFDVDKLSDYLEVRHAAGFETYVSFSGETELPAPGEVIFADGAGRAHARRWTNRQSRDSAVGPGTTEALIVAEAVHDSAQADVERLIAALAHAIGDVWAVTTSSALLSRSAPRFDW